MEHKTARLTLLIDPNKKAAFERLCAQQDLTASQVVRQMIRDYLAQHGVAYEPSGIEEVDVAEAARARGREKATVGPGLRNAKTPARAAGSRRKG